MESIVFAALERLINAQLETSTPARSRARALAGRRLRVIIVGPDIEVSLSADESGLRLDREAAAQADAALRGTPLALLEAWRAGKAGLLGGGAVTVTGDVEVLERFVDLLSLVKPDLEEELAGITGDIVAHESFRLASAVRGWVGHALDAVAMNAGEFLQEERRDLPSRLEIDSFLRDVERLRDDVERAAARAERLVGRAARATGHDGSAAASDA